MSSVSRNILSSTLGNLTNQVVRAGQQLLWVPLFLAAFGKEGYGEWVTLFGLAGYAVMADLGVQAYWLNLLTGAHVRGETENYRRLYRTGIFLFVVVGGLALLSSVPFAWANGPARVLTIEVMPAPVASAVFLVLVASTLLTVVMRMLLGTFRTVGQNPTVVWFEVAYESLTFVVVVGALFLGLGPLGLACVYGAIALSMLAWVVVCARRRFPELVDLDIHRADRAALTMLAGGGSIQLAGVAANLLLMQGTLIITGWALGAATVALVATSRTLANLVRQAAGAVYSSTLPEFSRLEAGGDREAMGRLLLRSISFVLLFSGVACIALVGLGPWLFDLWTGKRFPDAAPLIFLFAVSVMVDAPSAALNDFLLGCNRIARVAVSNIVYAAASLPMMWLLFPRLGALSVPVATMACGIVVRLPAMAAGTSEILGRDVLWALGRRSASAMLLVLMATLGFLYGNVGSLAIAPRIATVFAALALYGLVSYRFVLAAEDRAALVRMAERFVRARRI